MSLRYKPTKFMLTSSHYNKAYADHAVNFIQELKHTKGEWAGKNFMLLPWQEQIIRDLFGIVKADNHRQFNVGYIECPKKTGKSEIAAAVALYLLAGDGEYGAEIYGCAADRGQASIVFDVACQMVRQSIVLNKVIRIIPSQKRLVFHPTNSFYQVLSSETISNHGLNTHGVVFDELHAQPNRKLYDVMMFGSGNARKQPLYFLITTAGSDRHSICYEVHSKAVEILRGKINDPSFYPVIYSADEKDDWTDEKVWAKANPSLGVTVKIDKFRSACESAKLNPSEENLFRQMFLSQWTKQSVRWMPMEKWNKCDFKVDLDDLHGRACYGGLDLASTTDITALVLVFPPKKENYLEKRENQLDDKYIIIPYFWLPEETLQLRVNRDHVPYDIWQKQDLIMVTEGNVTHYEELETFISLLKDKYDIREIAYDRWNATQIVQRLTDIGITMVPFGQGFASMSSPTKELMKLVLEEKLAHSGNAPLAWMADNVTVRKDPAGNIKPDKEKSTEKIDGIVALIMGLDRALKNGNGQMEDPYKDRGIIVL